MSKLQELMHSHGKWLGLAAIGVVAVLLLVLRGKGKTAQSAATGAAPTAYPGASPVTSASEVPGTSSWSDMSNVVDMLSSQYQQMSNQQQDALNQILQQMQAGTPGATATPAPGPNPILPVRNPAPAAPPPAPAPAPKPAPAPAPTPRYFTVGHWPDWSGSLWGISQHFNLTLQRIEQMNPNIKNPDLIYPGEQVRIA